MSKKSYLIVVLVFCCSFFMQDNVISADLLLDGQLHKVNTNEQGIPLGDYDPPINTRVLDISDDGSILFLSTQFFNGQHRVFAKDLNTGTATHVTIRDDGSTMASLGLISQTDTYKTEASADGRFVLIPSGDNSADSDVNASTGNHLHLYVRDLLLSDTEQIHISTSGEIGNRSAFPIAISDDGRYVLFRSTSTNLVDTPAFLSLNPSSTNYSSVYIRDRQLGTTEEVLMPGANATVTSSSIFVSPLPELITPDFTYAYYKSTVAINRVELASNTLQSVSPANFVNSSETKLQDVTDLGDQVLISTWRELVDEHANNLDHYVIDMNDGSAEIVSVNSNEDTGNCPLSPTLGVTCNGSYSEQARISADGRYVMFHSFQALVDEDVWPPSGSSASEYEDVFIRDRDEGETYIVTSDGLTPPNIFDISSKKVMSRDGGVVAFVGYDGVTTDAYARDMNLVLNPDQNPPTITSVSWLENPLLEGNNTAITVSATDDLSGVVAIEYSIDGSVPSPLNYDPVGNYWIATFGSSLLANTYNIEIVARDEAGNVSSPYIDVLAVYNQANGYVTGHARVTPTSTDTLPIALDTSNNPKDVVIGFTNVMAPASGSFDVRYVVKNNQNEFTLDSTQIEWIVVSDSTHASILGQADLSVYIDGVETITYDVVVKFDISLGENGGSDHIVMSVYDPGASPYVSIPNYTVDQDVVSNGSNLMIHP